MRSTSSSVLTLAGVALAAVEKPPQEGWRLIELRPDARPVWLPEEAIDGLFALQGDMHGVPFADLTDHQHIVPHTNAGPLSYPTNPNYRTTVEEAIDRLDKSYPQKWLRHLTDLQNRYYDSETGVEGAHYIQEELQNIAKTNNRTDIDVSLFSHSFRQPSVIAAVPGSDPTLASQVVVVGAHEDSIASNMPNGRAPGADDDGSGSVTVMETYRVFVESGLRPKRTVEFQFYAGEERGLLGSADIAAAYNRNDVDVHGMLQFDMNGASGGSKYNVCVDNSFTDAGLTDFLRLMIEEYGTLDHQDFRYNYAASDHASYARNGYPAVHVKENVSYPPIHTANDVYENIDFDYLQEFTKVGVAFSIELGEA